MKNFGSFLFIVGTLAIVLNFFNRVPKILFWIYEWGDTVAWIIKIGLVLIGIALFILGGDKKSEEENHS